MVIAIKVFVREFYRLNASLFFLIIAFAGGFMRGPDHIALGELFISSVSLVLIPIFVWVAYAVVVMEFNAANLHKQGNSFLQCFPLFTKRFQWAFSIVIIACQLVPVILYAGFLSLLAFKNHIHHSFFLIAASLLLISCGMTYWLRQLLKNPTRKERVSLIHFLALHRIRWPYPFVVLRFVLSRRALSLLLYKLFSLSILWSSLYLYKTDNYDLRLLHLGVTISFSLGISFVIEWHAFENVFFSIVKRLPINFLKRSAYAFFIISLFVLPEAMLVLKNFPVEYATSDTLISIMFGASIYFLFYGFLYTRDRKQETIISYASITGLIFFILVLAGIPAGVLMMVNLTAGFLFFRFYYARFELHPDQVQPAKS